TRCYRDWSSDVCSSDLRRLAPPAPGRFAPVVTAPPVQTVQAPAVHGVSVAHFKHAKVQKKPAKSMASGKAKSAAILARHDSHERSEERRVGKKRRHSE